jgi:hypothetical protein
MAPPRSPGAHRKASRRGRSWFDSLTTSGSCHQNAQVQAAFHVEHRGPWCGVDVRVDSTEASAVLDLLARSAEGGAPTEPDLARIYATDAYARLKRRETEMKRPFTDAEFRAFVTSDALLERRPRSSGASQRGSRRISGSPPSGRAGISPPTSGCARPPPSS